MDQIEMTEPWSSIDEVAKTWEGRDSIYRWIEARGMPAHESGRLWKFKLSHFDEWGRAEGGEKPASKKAPKIKRGRS